MIAPVDVIEIFFEGRRSFESSTAMVVATLESLVSLSPSCGVSRLLTEDIFQ